ncbi:HEAT repeat-containing protein 6 isoform X2 [Episyrphus balteatus]|nr:HEAT repeat-containing protein 6 isoform X2 [Episyrphus balteatus]XP_055837463.1 HEAT repeat-containing protein 6 isoform X2 [Episyrphus balteatus]
MEEIIISIVLCIESLLSPAELVEMDNQTEDLLSMIGSKILAILYSDKIKFNRSAHHMNFMTTSLNVLHVIACENRDWCDANIGELLGLSKAFMHHGIPGIPQVQAQKVHISQQSIVDQGTMEANNRGGKVAKTRKPRTVNKNRKSDGKMKQNPNNDEAVLQLPSGSNLKVDFETPIFNKTSDSDFSESEASRTRNERHKQAKLRLAAISLIGLIAKNVDRKIFYGYWHSLFPNDASPGLLTCATRDPNPRCRVAALQAASVILFGSRSFLLQAEWSEKPPTTFMPFSISLANMIIAMYEVLTQALANESSLPVLTQILKCLTVLIQATPFHRLKPGLVTEFVKSIRKLVYHKDPTVQVAALMVMEFLISTPDITTEISEIVGIPKTLIGTMIRNQNRLNDSGVEEVIDTDYAEETLDSDSEDLISSPAVTSNSVPAEENANNTKEIAFKMSWLLQRVLENLGVLVTESKEKQPASTTPVRTECLQVLSSMAPHFSLLKDHLQFIAAALKSSLNDAQPDIRLYTAKCLDSLGHSMNTYLLEHGSPSNEELMSCQNFWISMLPSVIEKIQDADQSPALKAILCDFMSNIGVHVFERLSHVYHIQLIGILSGAGCNEENTVRAAAVRALAVYVLFPSLRENLVFVENTAESILQLIKDSNLFVRVRASWSMGNVSDALITNFFNSRVERISEDLLKRLLETAIESASDNDKVRSNAVRTLGNLLRLITPDHLKTPTWRTLVQKSVEKLVNCVNTGGNAKVKWNSCYAIGNFMKNSDLFNSQYNDMNWPNLVFPALCNLIVNHNNFKVRINGTAALMTIQERSNYGTRLQMVWTALLNAMEQSSNLTDFNEYKHRDNLQEQLCIAISHIISFSTLEDLNMLKTELVPKLEIVKQIWIRVVSRILPENAAPLLSCALKLQDQINKKELTTEQKNACKILSSCFTQPSVDSF